jgi:hypothetical protein
MNSIDNFSQSVIVSEAQNIDRGREEITISQTTINNGQFNMTVVNTGSLPVHLTRLWVTNQDGVTADQKADLDINLNPGQQQYNIGQSTGISAVSTASYNLKVVTERGNISTFQVSPNTSTRIQLVLPSTVGPDTTFRVTTLITNNSTSPNNIANLIPTLTNNATLVETSPNTPASIATLPQGNTVAFTSVYTAPSTPTVIQFNASYANAPTGSYVLSTIRAETVTAAEEASNSQWSQAASRVGILISGIPNPVETSSTTNTVRFGIGIINPLDRPVQIYSVTIHMPATTSGNYPFKTPLGAVEPSTPSTNWALTADKVIRWQSGVSPATIPSKSVGQFRVTLDTPNNLSNQEILTMIQVLSSEGKLSAIYSISSKNTFSTINVFYTNNTASLITPPIPNNNWGYLYEGIKSGTIGQTFNATVENAGGNTLQSKVKLILLIPADFKEVRTGTALDVINAASGWADPVISTNPDGSTVINVETSTSSFGLGAKAFRYAADVPTVTDTKLYVFQTTTVYPTWSEGNIISSALSEAGIQVIP